MRNSYDDDATDEVPTHLFEWAVGDEPSAPDAAAKLIKESATRQLEILREQEEHVQAAKDMSDFGMAAVEALEEVGFNADFEILPEGRVCVSFDDDEQMLDRRRRRLAEGLIGRLARAADGEVTNVHIMEFANGGDITVGLMSGIGFGSGPAGFDPNFNPFDQRNVKMVSELDVSVDDVVLERLEDLTSMWDGDYTVYNEGVELTLGDMSPEQRSSLAMWIESHVKRVGVPGTTLEEVLHDVHRRIRRHSRL